jgi:hypothetical protein
MAWQKQDIKTASKPGWVTTAERRPPRAARIDWISREGYEESFGLYHGKGRWETREGLVVAYTPRYWRPHAGGPA